ncbi:uncharacterized protein METZ01_LOCUS253216, partial [marine metagenome]
KKISRGGGLNFGSLMGGRGMLGGPVLLNGVYYLLAASMTAYLPG